MASSRPRTARRAALVGLRHDGGIDEVAAYPRTLSAAEVAEHYRIGTTGR